MSAESESSRSPRRLLWTPVGLLVAGLAVMWGIELVDSVLLDGGLDGNGLRPRERSGIDGIVWAPFLHADLGHLASNSVPLLVLGGLVAMRGMRYWAWVTVTSVVLGGGLTWLFAGGGVHIGASGVVFGYFGAVIGAAVFERRLLPVAAAAVALVLYSGIVAGLVPQDAVSWEGHLFGVIAGVVAARVLAVPADDRSDAAAAVAASPDEPWRS
ncbi:MAG: rhomboid family intramembrane serine protease [Ilumatobacter sp.]